MRQVEVRIGGTYWHKHRKVRIETDLGTRQTGRTNFTRGREVHRGWTATNLDTGRKVVVKSAKGLRPAME
jgi:hypothetical protein